MEYQTCSHFQKDEDQNGFKWCKVVAAKYVADVGTWSRRFDTFWDGRIDFTGPALISQFGSETPSKDALVTAAHLPVVKYARCWMNSLSENISKSPVEVAGRFMRRSSRTCRRTSQVRLRQCRYFNKLQTSWSTCIMRAIACLFDLVSYQETKLDDL
jgi:hypothetical protein